MLPLLLIACFAIDLVPTFAEPRCATERIAYVACVRDGDTIELESCGGEAVRMLGVDAPEIAHSDAEVDQCYGPESRAWTTDRLLDRYVRLSFDATCQDTYGRTLAYVYLLDEGDTAGEDPGTFINSAIIRSGYARVYEDFDNILLAEQLYTAQTAAEQANVGIWATCE